jgi:hypothetical protein
VAEDIYSFAIVNEAKSLIVEPFHADSFNDIAAAFVAPTASVAVVATPPVVAIASAVVESRSVIISAM